MLILIILTPKGLNLAWFCTFWYIVHKICSEVGWAKKPYKKRKIVKIISHLPRRPHKPNFAQRVSWPT